MIKILLTFVFCLLPLIASAEKYYVFIDKIGVVHKGQEAGHTAYGDVVGIHPFTPQYKPTRAELSRYKIMVVDLTQQERADLLESETEEQLVEGRLQEITVRARKRKVNIGQMHSIKQEKEISKNELFQRVVTKPTFVNHEN